MTTIDAINKLKALRELSIKNQAKINELTQKQNTFINKPIPTSSETFVVAGYDKSNSYIMPTNFEDALLADFRQRNKHIIDARIEREQSAVILGNVLKDVIEYDDIMLEKQLTQANISSLMQNTAIKPKDIIKQIHIDIDNKTSSGKKAKTPKQPKTINNIQATPKAKNTSGKCRKLYTGGSKILLPTICKSTKLTDYEKSVCSIQRDDIDNDTACKPELEDLNEYEQKHVFSYIEQCYAHIIKVLKVYFILADGKKYVLPSGNKIGKIKTMLEGYIHVVNLNTLVIGTHIYYLTVDLNNKVKIMDGYVYEINMDGCYIIIIDETNNKKIKVRDTCPIFRKLNNYDIAGLLY